MKRRIIQLVTALGTNAYLPGFFKGNIYKGGLKTLCVPGLNCYSCPGALGSCPVGALQAVLGSPRYGFSFYVVGMLALFGLIFGRFVCGFLCPFGLLQELLHKLPFPRVRRPWPWLKYLKYAVLAVFVLALPALLAGPAGVGSPTFCQYICPAGTLTAGVPLVAANPPLRQALGWLFAWKAAVLAGVVVGCLLVFRFFCRFLCPLGAIYALFNRFSLYRLRRREDMCSGCGVCAKICPMDADPMRHLQSPECIRCGACVKACPTGALRAGFGGGERTRTCGSCGRCRKTS